MARSCTGEALVETAGVERRLGKLSLARRFDQMGIAHGPLIDRGPGSGVQLDVPDPDGTVIRFLSPLGEHPPFMGIEFHADGGPTFYDTPRLSRL